MRCLSWLLLLSTFSACPCVALAQPVTVKMQGSKVVIGQEQGLMLQAAENVLKKDYPAALALYNQVLGLNPSSVEAYLQRSVVRREMKDAGGSQADAAQAVRMSESALAKAPQNPRLYYQRGTGYRLLRDFAKARENIRYAIQLSGGRKAEWQSDLQAIDLEEKMAQ